MRHDGSPHLDPRLPQFAKKEDEKRLTLILAAVHLIMTVIYIRPFHKCPHPTILILKDV